jgi:hypothetical protein
MCAKHPAQSHLTQRKAIEYLHCSQLACTCVRACSQPIELVVRLHTRRPGYRAPNVTLHAFQTSQHSFSRVSCTWLALALKY